MVRVLPMYSLVPPPCYAITLAWRPSSAYGVLRAVPPVVLPTTSIPSYCKTLLYHPLYCHIVHAPIHVHDWLQGKGARDAGLTKAKQHNKAPQGATYTPT